MDDLEALLLDADSGIVVASRLTGDVGLRYDDGQFIRLLGAGTETPVAVDFVVEAASSLQGFVLVAFYFRAHPSMAVHLLGEVRLSPSSAAQHAESPYTATLLAHDDLLGVHAESADGSTLQVEWAHTH